MESEHYRNVSSVSLFWRVFRRQNDVLPSTDPSCFPLIRLRMILWEEFPRILIRLKDAAVSHTADLRYQPSRRNNGVIVWLTDDELLIRSLIFQSFRFTFTLHFYFFSCQNSAAHQFLSQSHVQEKNSEHPDKDSRSCCSRMELLKKKPDVSCDKEKVRRLKSLTPEEKNVGAADSSPPHFCILLH